MLTVVSFLLVMSVLVFVHELGHFLVAKRNKIVVEEFGFGYPPRILKLFERDGTIYSINAIPFGGFVRMRGEDDPTLPGSFAAASKRARSATLLAGPGMNFALAVVLFASSAMLTGYPDTSRPGAIVTGIEAGSPAEAAGLQIGDRIFAADNVSLPDTKALLDYTRQHLGQPVVYRIARPGASGGSTTTVELTIVPRVNPPREGAYLGIGIEMARRPAAVWEAAWSGIQGTAEVVALTFLVPATLIREGRPIDDARPTGPLGIAVFTGQVVERSRQVSSAVPILNFMALLSAALAITNLLPLPALDGGRLLFIAVELVRGRRIDPAREGLVHLVGFGLLLFVVGLVTFQEISLLRADKFPKLFGP